MSHIYYDTFIAVAPDTKASIAGIHGWGVVFDAEGKAALCAVESPEYQAFLENPGLTVLHAMRSKRS